MIRSFVAIELPDAMQLALREVGDRLQLQVPDGCVRWTRVSGIHLTLKFLGNVAEADLPKIQSALAEVAQRHVPFVVTVTGLGCFPNTRRPRVLWVGVEEETGKLKALQRDVEKSLFPLGFEMEKRPFHPHLTLGRTQRSIRSADQSRLAAIVSEANVGQLGRIQVDSFRLMRSDLHPDGARYTLLQAFPLSRG
jgi:2'-5' RNA ligase